MSSTDSPDIESTTQWENDQQSPLVSSSSSSSPSPSSSLSASPTRSSSPFLRISLSSTSLSSLLLPSFYLPTHRSTPNLISGTSNDSPLHRSTTLSPSDLLARESDVIVSTNITSQLEYKGFASYVISGIFLAVWLFWSLCPDSVLIRLGICYYPSRWWAIAVPSFILVTMGYIYVALALYNIEVKTLPLNDLRTVVDDTGVIVTQLESYDQGVNENEFLFKSTSGIWDLSLHDVNKVLYNDEKI